MLKFNEFVEYVKEHVLDSNPTLRERAKIKVSQYTKINGKVVTALTIFEEGSNVSPTLRLEDYYKSYCNGTSLENCITQMVKMYEEYKIGNFNIGVYVDNFECASPNLIMKLLSREKNEALLTELPHFVFGNLAVTFSVCVSDAFGRGGIAVNYAMMKEWNVTEDDLLEAAFANMQKKDSTIVFRFDPVSVLGNTGENVQNISYIEKGWPYVLTSSEGIFGASSMLRLDVLQEFADKAECNIFIVPLSIDECLLVQDDGMVSTEQLEKVLAEINRDVNPEEYFLSNSIYYYDREKHVLSDNNLPMILTIAREENCKAS